MTIFTDYFNNFRYVLQAINNDKTYTMQVNPFKNDFNDRIIFQMKPLGKYFPYRLHT